MPEGGRHAPILIATSWQALNRAMVEGPDSLLCNCTIVILFAGFYVEANLNHIVDRVGMTDRMNAFLDAKHPGLQDKLAWFYNEFIARRRAANRKELYRRRIMTKLRRRFPGFGKLYRFRNDLSHGVVNDSARSLREARRLREQAKAIASDLFGIASRHGHQIPRDTNYYDAIAPRQRRYATSNTALHPTPAAEP